MRATARVAPTRIPMTTAPVGAVHRAALTRVLPGTNVSRRATARVAPTRAFPLTDARPILYSIHAPNSFSFPLYELGKLVYNIFHIKEKRGDTVACMRCGRDLAEGQVFCQRCREDMDRYPVKPGIAVQLPSRRPEAPKRAAPRRRTLPPEEQVKRLRRLNRTLSFLLALSLILVAFFGYISVLHLLEEDTFLPGQNYTSIETTVP